MKITKSMKLFVLALILLISINISIGSNIPDIGFTPVFTPKSWSDFEGITKSMNIVNDTGAEWIRVCFYWNELQDDKGNYIFHEADKLVEICRKKNIKIFGIIMGYHAKSTIDKEDPNWHYAGEDNNNDGIGDQKWPSFDTWDSSIIADYRSFIGAIIERYKPHGTLSIERGWDDDYGVSYWEHENACDRKCYWSDEIYNVDKYVNILKNVYEAAKYADNNCKLVLAPLGTLVNL